MIIKKYTCIKQHDMKLNKLEKYKVSVLEHTNYFSAESKLEEEYYHRFVKYQTDYQKLKIELNRSEVELKKVEKDLEQASKDLQKVKMDHQLTKRAYVHKKEEIIETIEQLQLLEESILTQINMFSNSDTEYFNRFIDYELSITQLQSVIDQRKEKYEISTILGESYVPRQQIQLETMEYESARLDLENFRNDHLLRIRSSIVENKKLLNEVEVSIERANEDLNFNALTSVSERKRILDQEMVMSAEYKETLLEKYEIDMIVQINEAIKLQEDKIKNTEDQVESLMVSMNNYIVTSPIDGYVHVLSEINTGDLIQPGTEILTVVPGSQSQYKVILSVLNQDITDISEGDEIKYHFFALPYKEYGELKGRITKISIDSTVNPQDGNSFYTVEATIDNEPLYSYKGDEATIKVGMIAEAYVITDSKKILYYLLEKIDLRE